MCRVMHGISSLQGSLQDRATTHNPPCPLGYKIHIDTTATFHSD